MITQLPLYIRLSFIASIVGTAALLHCSQQAFAAPTDSTSRLFFAEARLLHGIIIIHSRDIRAIEDSYPWGAEFDIGRQLNSDKAWNSCNCYPRVGLSLSFWDFDNRDILGHALTGQVFLEPEFLAHKKFSFSVRGGLGLAYLTQPHHPELNPDNLSYSTSVAFPLHAGASLHWKISDSWRANLSGRYYHISNGGMKQPNKGINWPTASIGITYFPQGIKLRERPKTPWRSAENRPQHRSAASFMASYREGLEGGVRPIVGLELRHTRQVSRINALGLATEALFYSGRRPEDADLSGDFTGFRAGAAAVHEFLLGRFSFNQQFGVYLTAPEGLDYTFYQRYELRYTISEKWSVGSSLKTHGHVADFLDVRVGYRL